MSLTNITKQPVVGNTLQRMLLATCSDKVAYSVNGALQRHTWTCF